MRRPIDRRAFNIAYKEFLERCLADLEYDLSIVKSDIDRLSDQLRDLENEKSELTDVGVLACCAYLIAGIKANGRNKSLKASA